MDIAPPVAAPLRLKRAEFQQFHLFLKEQVGIHMAETKLPLVEGRLAKRVHELGVASYGDYLALIRRNKSERQLAIDRLTTNETFFFREPKHFDLLARQLAPAWRQRSDLRIWCGACSTGEEPYTIAMVLADALGHTRFEILASDISTRVLQTAREALYPMEDAKDIPVHLRNRHCLKGIGSQTGRFMVHPNLCDRVEFEQINLNAPLPDIGQFDAIFLRNVMIYFSVETKREVMARVLRHLKPNGHFFISHSESLHGVTDGLRAVMPSVYRLRSA